MSDEQINIAIAEACGWTEVTDTRKFHQCPTGFPPNSKGTLAYVPNYCGDLNAMHEAEKIGQSLQAGFWTAYNAALKLAGAVYISHATARQRAEAFLRTTGKWEEAK